MTDIDIRKAGPRIVMLILLAIAGEFAHAATCTPLPKKGVAAASVANSDPSAIGQLNIAWYYDWTPDNAYYSGYTGSAIYVPEFWDASEIMPVSGNSPWVFTFNEPNVGTQSNMTVAQAIAAWPEVEADSDGKMIGSPDVAGDFGGGLSTSNETWLASFMSEAAADRYTVNFIALHAYAEGDGTALTAQVTSFESYISGMHALYPSYPIVVNEFALDNLTTWNGAGITAAEQAAFMDIVVPWMDSQPWIIGYSWYSAYDGGANSDLLNSNGSLSDIGTAYSLLGCSATTTAQGISLAGTSVTVSPGATSGNTSTITVAGNGGYTGTVVLTAAITSGPSGAEDSPTLSFGSTSPVGISDTAAAGPATLTISTTAPASAALARPSGASLFPVEGMALACVVLLVPVRHRRWQKLLMAAFLLFAVSGVLACGGGSGGTTGGGGGNSNAGTTPGTYTVTITGTDSATSTITSTTTITLTVT